MNEFLRWLFSLLVALSSYGIYMYLTHIGLGDTSVLFYRGVAAAVAVVTTALTLFGDFRD